MYGESSHIPNSNFGASSLNEPGNVFMGIQSIEDMSVKAQTETIFKIMKIWY